MLVNNKEDVCYSIFIKIPVFWRIKQALERFLSDWSRPPHFRERKFCQGKAGNRRWRGDCQKQMAARQLQRYAGGVDRWIGIGQRQGSFGGGAEGPKRRQSIAFGVCRDFNLSSNASRRHGL